MVMLEKTPYPDPFLLPPAPPLLIFKVFASQPKSRSLNEVLLNPPEEGILSHSAPLSPQLFSSYKAESIGTQMRYFAKKLHRGFSIPALQFAVGRAHAAHGFDLAGRTLCLAGDLFLSQGQ